MPKSSDSLIREWLFRFGVNFEKDAAPILPVWLESFGGIDAAVLEKLFVRALQVCKFFPKVAEILEPLHTAEKVAVPEAAAKAWEHVLEIRRVYWNPDIPGPFDRALAQLSERVRTAARACGVFREFTAEEYESGALHTWAKKRFIESFLAWEELQKDQFLLPDGEVKDLLADAAETKALPAPKISFEELHMRGFEHCARLKQSTPELSPEARLLVADQLAEAARQVIARDDAKRRTITVSDGDREAFRKQAERIKALYPESKTTDPVLLQFVRP